MKAAYFISGTDTEVGKTFAACALLSRADHLGLKTLAFKPVAAGALHTLQGARNEDGLALQKAINQPLSYPEINPFCLAPAIAPHIAAQEAGIRVTVDRIEHSFRLLQSKESDFCLVEGAGGWRVPLNESEAFSDIAIALNLPVILVVSMRLGCISHTLLTAEAIARDGLRLAGWIANQTSDNTMSRYHENLDYLRRVLPAPLLGELPYYGNNIPAEGYPLTLPDGLDQPARGC